jgi:hypothetical protein
MLSIALTTLTKVLIIAFLLLRCPRPLFHLTLGRIRRKSATGKSGTRNTALALLLITSHHYHTIESILNA